MRSTGGLWRPSNRREALRWAAEAGADFVGFVYFPPSPRAVTPAQAVAHPNWSMGAKISVDSATMMNKGLEMIEASYLFDTPEDRIDAVIHPQSVIHSLVEYADGSTLAQLGPPDMRSPIAYAFAWPDRLDWPAPRLDLAAIANLSFQAPDNDRFPAVALARTAISLGEGGPAALNAANEIAVAAFLDHKIGFLDIARACEEALETMDRGGELAADGGWSDRGKSCEGSAY